MPTLKKLRRALGKKIRRETGLKLPIAMQMARRIQQDGMYQVAAKFPEFVESYTDCECCGPAYRIKGPKGTLKRY